MTDSTVWTAALGEEVSFWTHYLATRGHKWPDDFADRLNPDLPLQEELLPYLSHVPAAGEVRILDCGAGPLTILGKRWNGRKVSIVPVDALADEYDRLLREHDIKPLVRTLRCEAERLDEMFAPDRFDLVYMRNALDHSHDPLLALRQMLRVVKPGCAVFLDHEVDVGHKRQICGSSPMEPARRTRRTRDLEPPVASRSPKRDSRPGATRLDPS